MSYGLHKRGATLLSNGKAIATAELIVYVRQESCILCCFCDATFLEDVGEHCHLQIHLLLRNWKP